MNRVQQMNDFHIRAPMFLLKILMVLFVFGMMSSCGEAVRVAKKEFGSEAMLKKYEWFKTTAQQLYLNNKKYGKII